MAVVLEVSEAELVKDAQHGDWHVIVDLDLSSFEASALTSAKVDVPQGRTLEQTGAEIPVTYVPARNIIFLSVAAGLCETVGATTIFIGANAVDYSGYPDCRPEFFMAFEKVLLEPYGLDPRTGRVAWAADKKKTDKDNYRVKIKGDVASVALTMFHCEQTDVLPLFDPRKMDYLTKVQLLDGATGAIPLRYWYSRVDGRNTRAISIFLEKGTRFKLIMSDNLLRKELILLNGSPERPEGKGFLIGDPLAVPIAPFQVAQDTRYLLAGRIENLHRRGIVNRHLEGLYESSVEELTAAQAQVNVEEDLPGAKPVARAPQLQRDRGFRGGHHRPPSNHGQRRRCNCRRR